MAPRNDHPFGLRRSSQSRRSDQGSSLLDVPAFEIKSNLSLFALFSQSGRPGALFARSEAFVILFDHSDLSRENAAFLVVNLGHLAEGMLGFDA